VSLVSINLRGRMSRERDINERMHTMKMLLALLLVSGSAMAQTYDISLTLGGFTYQGDFTFTPDTIVNTFGQTIAGPGVYSNVAVSSPTGILTQAYDVFDGNNLTQHAVWFSSTNGATDIGLFLPSTPGALSVAVQGAEIYTGSLYESCTVCNASITEVVTQSLHEAPEISASGATSSLTLLGCSLLILLAKRRRS
jgi:hypothetical protein